MCSVTAHQYVCLAGQHSLWALQQLRKKCIDENREAPDWIASARCRVVRADCPLGERQQLAGDQQFQQGTVQALLISEWARLLLTPDVATIPDEGMRLMRSLRKSGFDRTKKEICLVLPPPCVHMQLVLLCWPGM